jgi:DNA polymerase III subunit epsilon
LTEYLLFIDTEASGLPGKWYLPYTAPGNWPYAVQVSWIIYNREGIKIKEQNFYISDNDFEISPSSFRIHGLTKDFLLQNGIPRRELLEQLTKDLMEYRPMIIGHFLELDYHILGAEYSRIGTIHHPLQQLPGFCIMTASRHLQKNPNSKYLRLGELYELLFNQPLLCQHNAITDATATAGCFFELVKRNEIKSFTQPPIAFQQKEKVNTLAGWVIVILLILCSVLLIISYYG